MLRKSPYNRALLLYKKMYKQWMTFKKSNSFRISYLLKLPFMNPNNLMIE